MRKWFSVLGLAAGVFLTAWCGPVPAQAPADKKPAAKKPAAAPYIRVKRDAQDQPVTLETATVRFVPAAGDGKLVVDLVGVVHIGDRAYYDALNKQLDDYDVVLYELVAPEGMRVPKGGKRDGESILGLLQQVLKSALELELQTDQIDYTKKHFVHADLSPDQMGEEIRKRGDNGLSLFLSVAGDMIRQQNLREMDKPKKPARPEPEVDLFALLFDPDRAVKLKRLMAEGFEELDGSASGLGPTLDTIVITDRNKAALRVFQKELAKGRKKVAIFYGAGHMPDFEQRLRDDFGLKRDSERWLTAWDMDGKKKGKKE